MTDLPASDEIDGDDAIVPESVRERGLEPGPAFFFITLVALILAMVIAALVKHRW